MNLTGHWEGHYTYGRSYPEHIIGRSEPFAFEITDEDGTITGTCTDNLTKAKEDNESYIIGTFRENEITFKKRYKTHLVIDESGNLGEMENIKSDGVDYKGRLRKKFFSKRYYFSGYWSISLEARDENNITVNYMCHGTWKMSKK